jgi:hypothetical protein
MITIISRRRPPYIMHHTSALQWMRGDGWDSLIHYMYQHRRHCHSVAKAALHTVHVAKGKAKGKAKFQVGPDAEVSRDVIVLLGGAHGAVVRDSTPTPRSRRRWGGVREGNRAVRYLRRI